MRKKRSYLFILIAFNNKKKGNINKLEFLYQNLTLIQCYGSLKSSL